MKHKKNIDNNTHNIPDLDIIDLDVTDLDADQGSNTPPVSEQPEIQPEESYLQEDSQFQEDNQFQEDTQLQEDSQFQEDNQLQADSYLPEDGTWITEDGADDGSEEDNDDDFPEDSSGKRRIPHAVFHLGFALAVILIIGLVFWRIWNYGTLRDLADYEGDYSAEVLDSIMPLIPKEGVTVEDDGQTTIVAFGNAPFADDRDSEDSLANIIEDMTGATVYNCSVGSSYLAAEGASLSMDIAPMDAFNFYWLTTAFCLRNNQYVFEDIFNALGNDMPKDGLEAYETLMDIDFSKVDVIVLMYDGSDYLAGHNMYSDSNDTDIQCFTGNMCAGIDLIQDTYPHIRIIVMSPTYAFAINEEGEYVSSDQYRYNDQDVLSTYVIKQFGYCYDRSVTFVDNLYGTITEDNATQYLTDNLHLNAQGRKLAAERFVYALNYFNKTTEE